MRVLDKVEKVEHNIGVYIDGCLVNKFIDDKMAVSWVNKLLSKGIAITNYTIDRCSDTDKINKIKLLEVILL